MSVHTAVLGVGRVCSELRRGSRYVPVVLSPPGICLPPLGVPIPGACGVTLTLTHTCVIAELVLFFGAIFPAVPPLSCHPEIPSCCTRGFSSLLLLSTLYFAFSGHFEATGFSSSKDGSGGLLLQMCTSVRWVAFQRDKKENYTRRYLLLQLNYAFSWKVEARAHSCCDLQCLDCSSLPVVYRTVCSYTGGAQPCQGAACMQRCPFCHE